MTDYEKAGREFGRLLVSEARRRGDIGVDFDGRDMIVGCVYGLNAAGATVNDIEVFTDALDAEVDRVGSEFPTVRRSRFTVIEGGNAAQGNTDDDDSVA